MKRGKITAILLVASMLMGLAGCAQANPETTKEDADEGREEAGGSILDDGFLELPQGLLLRICEELLA